MLPAKFALQKHSFRNDPQTQKVCHVIALNRGTSRPTLYRSDLRISFSNLMMMQFNGQNDI